LPFWWDTIRFAKRWWEQKIRRPYWSIVWHG